MKGLKLLITGSTGFIGQRVSELAHKRGWNYLLQKRTSSATPTNSNPTETAHVPDCFLCTIDQSTDWEPALEGIDCIIHCAAHVHRISDKHDTLLTYRQVNTLGTLRLAEQAARRGVKRFVFLSSIKVNGEYSQENEPFGIEIHKKPTDGYGRSKYDAELGLKEIAQTSGLEIVIIRPPLVYGPGVKANFLMLMKLVEKGFPLPLAAIENKRSLLFLDNLVDLIFTCCKHPDAPGNIFLASDNHDVSTPDLLSILAQQMHMPLRIFSVPASFLKTSAWLLGRSKQMQRLCSSLQVDISKTLETLNWQPPYTFEEGIRATVNGLSQPHRQITKGESWKR